MCINTAVTLGRPVDSGVTALGQATVNLLESGVRGALSAILFFSLSFFYFFLSILFSGILLALGYYFYVLLNDAFSCRAYVSSVMNE
jgi:hypothetical protein